MNENTPIPESTNTFCWYPFYQISLKQFEGAQPMGSAPCCNSIRPELEDPLALENNAVPLDDIFHSAPMKKLREDLLSGVKNPICNVCWKAEEKAVTSYRFFSCPPAELEVDVTQPQLKGLDIGFGEECNLRCRMCTPGQSNKLRVDDKFFRENKTPGRPFYLPGWNNPSKVDPSEVAFFHESAIPFQDLLKPHPTVRQLRATGGETLRTKAFLQFLDNSIEKNIASEIILAYHTNATKFTDPVVEKLKLFKDNRPTFSIDSVGKNYEYIRFPMPWDMLEKSVDNYLAKVPTTSLFANSAVSALNLHYLSETCQWFMDKVSKIRTPEFRFFMNLDPVWPQGRPIDVIWLPPTMIEGQIQKLKEAQTRFDEKWFSINFSTLIDYLNHGLHNQKSITPVQLLAEQRKMYLEITAFDKARNQSYRHFLHPEMTSFLDGIAADMSEEDVKALTL